MLLIAAPVRAPRVAAARVLPRVQVVEEAAVDGVHGEGGLPGLARPRALPRPRGATPPPAATSLHGQRVRNQSEASSVEGEEEGKEGDHQGDVRRYSVCLY